MSKEKKNRFYYSKKQNEIEEEMWDRPIRFRFVETPDGWKQYSEWCSVKGTKCNWEDAELVYETDDMPEIVIHKGIPELISDLEAKLEESEETINNLEQQCLICNKDKENEQLKQQLAESEIKLNRYPYKNDVIEEEYEDLKDAITFLMLNNIKDQEQLNYSIDVLCEKHKARIRDIENSICKIEQLEQQLAEKEKEIEDVRATHIYRFYLDKYKVQDIYMTDEMLKVFNQDKISFCIEKLEKVKEEIIKLEQNYNLNLCDVKIYNFIDNQIKELKEGK